MTSDERVVLAASEHEEWSRMARGIAGQISRLLPDAVIEHIGSTSVPDLPAKPVVDLAVGVPADRVDDATEVLARHGFDHEGSRAGHTWLSSPDRSARAYVVHVLDLHGTGWERRLRFRDILRTDAAARARYLAVKQRSAASSIGWDDYTQSKTAIVSELLCASCLSSPGASAQSRAKRAARVRISLSDKDLATV